jgi:hypothetical protein
MIKRDAAEEFEAGDERARDRRQWGTHLRECALDSRHPEHEQLLVAVRGEDDSGDDAQDSNTDCLMMRRRAEKG